MSGSDQLDRAIGRLRETFDAAAEEAEELSEGAKRDVKDAIDDLEEQIDRLRNRD